METSEEHYYDYPSTKTTAPTSATMTIKPSVEGRRALLREDLPPSCFCVISSDWFGRQRSGCGSVCILQATENFWLTHLYFTLAVADLLLLLTLPFWAADAIHGWELGSLSVNSYLPLQPSTSPVAWCCWPTSAWISTWLWRQEPEAQAYACFSKKHGKKLCLVVWTIAFFSCASLIWCFSTVKSFLIKIAASHVSIGHGSQG